MAVYRGEVADASFVPCRIVVSRVVAGSHREGSTWQREHRRVLAPERPPAKDSSKLMLSKTLRCLSDNHSHPTSLRAREAYVSASSGCGRLRPSLGPRPCAQRHRHGNSQLGKLGVRTTEPQLFRYASGTAEPAARD